MVEAIFISNLTHIIITGGDMRKLKKVTLKLWHPGCWSIESTRDHPNVCLIAKRYFQTWERNQSKLPLGGRKLSISA